MDPVVLGLERQLRQVIRAVLHNAIEAMAGKGILGLKTQEVAIDGIEHVEIVISDTGSWDSRAREALSIRNRWREITARFLG